MTVPIQVNVDLDTRETQLPRITKSIAVGVLELHAAQFGHAIVAEIQSRDHTTQADGDLIGIELARTLRVHRSADPCGCPVRRDDRDRPTFQPSADVLFQVVFNDQSPSSIGILALERGQRDFGTEAGGEADSGKGGHAGRDRHQGGIVEHGAGEVVSVASDILEQSHLSSRRADQDRRQLLHVGVSDIKGHGHLRDHSAESRH